MKENGGRKSRDTLPLNIVLAGSELLEPAREGKAASQVLRKELVSSNSFV